VARKATNGKNMPDKKEKHETKNKKNEHNSKKYQTANPQRKIHDE